MTATVELAKVTPGSAPSRRMPSLRRIRKHHGLPPSMTCFRCKRTAQCDKAHIIDRVNFPDGTPVEVRDSLDNFLPLCYACHKVQPPFIPEDIDAAWAWMRFDARAFVAAMFYGEDDPIRRELVELAEELGADVNAWLAYHQDCSAERWANEWAEQIENPEIGLTYEVLFDRAYPLGDGVDRLEMPAITAGAAKAPQQLRSTIPAATGKAPEGTITQEST